jgi:acetyl-CoA carboxylase biotin carboxyl carrier protein
MSKARTPKSNSKKETSAKSFSGSPSTNQSEMKTSEIRDLIDFISKTGLNEVNIETQQLKLHVKREPDQKVFKSTPVSMASAPFSAPVQQQAQQSSAPKAEAPVAAGKKTVDIKSPMIGTFYRSSGPESGPFISVGDKVSKGQTVCIIEAMKLFNEIESEVSGTIIKVMAENSSPVEYEQVLFVVEPD